MPAGLRHDDLRQRNRALVIGAVRRESQPSRTEIAGKTGLSHSTISVISSDLIAEGVLVEVKGSGAIGFRRGRPQVAMALNPEAGAILTMMLLLDFLTATVVDYAGNIVAREEKKLATLHLGDDELVGECLAMAARLMRPRALAGRHVLRVILAVQGTIDAARRTLLWSPITPHSDIAFGKRLEEAFTLPVTVENDCNMIALALRWRDPLRYNDDFIAILLSHGIGMGLVLKGELFTGTQSSGGEFGHMVHRPQGALCRCGRRGCVEAYAGNYAIWRQAHGISDDVVPAFDISDADMKALAAAARKADGPQREAYRRAGEALGFGLGSLFALIDPAPVAMVGIGADAFDIIEPNLRQSLAQTAGGQHSAAISFATETDEVPLIHEGCTIRGLTLVDNDIVATRSDA